jgi:hypothetical protein
VFPQNIGKVVEGLRSLGYGVVVDAPSKTEGTWFLDVRGPCNWWFVVQYRADSGWGLSKVRYEDQGFGEGPEEVCATEAVVIERIESLFAPFWITPRPI